MAGTVICDFIQAAGSSLSMNVGNTLVLTANSSGLTYIPTGNVNVNIGSTASLTLGTLVVSNTATFSNTTTHTGAATFASTLGVTGATTLSSTLGVTGASLTLGGDTVAAPILSINGTAGSSKQIKWFSAGVEKWNTYMEATTHTLQWASTAVAPFVLSLNQATGAVTIGGTTDLSGTVQLNSISNIADKRVYIGGSSSPSYNASASLEFNSSSTAINWAIRTNWFAAGQFAIVPSTVVGGVGYNTPALAISNTGAVTIPGTVSTSNYYTVTGGAGQVTLDNTGLYQVSWPTTATPANTNVANNAYAKLVTSLRANKTEITSISEQVAIDTVMAMRGVTYRSAIDEDQREWAGFIAEETKEANPILAMFDSLGDLQSISYDRVPAYMIPVLQKHEREIQALRAELQQLRTPQ